MFQPDISAETNKVAFLPTEEQQRIVSVAKTGKNIAIQAYAGASKTTTCVLIAQEVRKPSLYIAFNKSIAEEASEKFPSHVECRSLHSLAWQSIVKGTGFQRKGRLVGYWDKEEIEYILSGTLRSITMEQMEGFIQKIISCLKEFCQSAYASLIEFMPFFKVDDETDINLLENSCVIVWDNLTNPNAKWKITHDIYLKLFQLSKPDLSDRFDVIYLDESQDSNPVTLDIFMNQPCQLIAVGDPFQAIYGWRGAVNAFEAIPETWEKLYLTESFRFNQQIADRVNPLLKYMGATLPLKGRGNGDKQGMSATLVRNNSTLFTELQIAANSGKKVYVVGDLEEIFNKLYTASSLFYAHLTKNPVSFGPYADKQISQFKSWKELSSTEDANLKTICKVTESCKPSVHAVITSIRRILIQDMALADMVLCTGHKSKGLEFPYVTLTNDFAPYPLKNEEGNLESFDTMLYRFVEEQGMNLLYVAMTRTQTSLTLGEGIEEFLYELTH